MSLDQFVQKWLGKRTDYDHVYAYQCVDLILQYLAEVHGIPSGVWGNAIDYWTKPTARLLQDFEKVTGTPQAGDIVILNPTSTNQYGHIMIAVNNTTAVEQNGATGDGDGLGGDEVRYRTIPLNRVAGLLRKKGAIVDRILTTHEARMIYLEYGYDVAGNDPALVNRKELELRTGIAGMVKNERQNLQNAITGLTNKANGLEAELNAERQGYELQIGALKGQLETVTKNQEILQSQFDELKKVVTIKDNEINRLKALVSDENLSVKQAIKVLYRTIVDSIKS